MTQPISPPEGKMRAKKNLLILAGLLLIGGVGASGYYLGLNSTRSDDITQPAIVLPATGQGEETLLVDETNALLTETTVGQTEKIDELTVNFTGEKVDEVAKVSIQLTFFDYLQKQGFSMQAIQDEERQLTFNVIRMNAQWFLGIGIVEGTKNCVITEGATECGLPGPSVLMLGKKTAGQWQVAVEYTDDFVRLIKEAPADIMTEEQKKVYLPAE